MKWFLYLSHIVHTGRVLREWKTSIRGLSDTGAVTDRDAGRIVIAFSNASRLFVVPAKPSSNAAILYLTIYGRENYTILFIRLDYYYHTDVGH